MAMKDAPAKLPRKIGGVKVPKAVRKGVVADFLGSQAGKAIIAEAVMAIGAAVVANQAKPGSATRRAGKAAKQAVKSAGAVVETAGDGAVALAPTTVAFAFAEASRAFAEALKGRPPGAKSPDDDWPADFEAPATKGGAKSTKAAAEPAQPKPH